MKRIKGGTRMGFDSSTKSFVTSTNTYRESVTKHRMLGALSLFGDISDSSSDYILDGDANELTLGNIFYNNFVKRYCNQLILEITVPGRSKRICGTLVDIYWPSSIRGELANKLYKGLYLIKSITHQFAARGKPPYKQKLVLMKFLRFYLKELWILTGIYNELIYENRFKRFQSI